MGKAEISVLTTVMSKQAIVINGRLMTGPSGAAMTPRLLARRRIISVEGIM